MDKIPFNQPFTNKDSLSIFEKILNLGHLSGDGEYTKWCNKWLEENLSIERVLMTHSCTAALEMAAMLLDIKPGDEVIMPSYTFVSSANAFVLRGGVPVFVDIRSDTMNIDEGLIEAAISSKTKAILVVHYAGVSCEMDVIRTLAEHYKIKVIEDAAQAIMSKYNGKALGSIGEIGAFSFHETKNISSGEGGALLINDLEYAKRAEIIREKGTDRSQFFRREINKYTWQDIGSSYLPSELITGLLKSQLVLAKEITTDRLGSWDYYNKLLGNSNLEALIELPFIPESCEHNGHMFYVKVMGDARQEIIEYLKKYNISAAFHYVPLHSSPGGKKYGRVSGSMKHTDMASECLLRLPLWFGIKEKQIDRVVQCLSDALANK